MRLFSDSIGRKAVMAITGLLMVLWVVGHMLGNLTIFAGPSAINAYSAKLHDIPAALWSVRVVMIAAVALHVIFGVQVTLENSAAKPDGYVVRRWLRSTFAGRTMIWTGLLIAAYVAYHLLQFTFHVTPDVVYQPDPQNVDRADVFLMVLNSLAVVPIAAAYIAAMVMLFLHLLHGIQSTFQTLGLTTAKTLPEFGVLGKVLSAIFLVGFGSIPVLILVRILVQ